jgi:hypothetical protein
MEVGLERIVSTDRTRLNASGRCPRKPLPPQPPTETEEPSGYDLRAIIAP